MAFGPAKLDGDVLAVDIAGLFQTNPKARNIVRKWLRRGAVEEPNYRQSALLRTRSERPRYGGAADKCEPSMLAGRAPPARNPMRQTLPDCCARAVIGHTDTAPPNVAINSRRLIRSTRRQAIGMMQEWSGRAF